MRSNLITASRLSSFRQCPRLHALKYELGYRPVEDSDALAFGTLMHKGLEAWWRCWQNGVGDTALDGALVSMVTDDDWARVKAQVLMTGYHLRWAPTMDQWEVLAVEQKFESPLLTGEPVTGRSGVARNVKSAGKLDAIARKRSDGAVWYFEHKTSGEDVSAGSAYWVRRRMDPQVSIYHDACRALGYEPAGCVYDVIRKPTLRPLKANTKRAHGETPDEYQARVAADIAERPEDYYVRAEVVRLADELIEARRDTYATACQLRDSIRLGRSPRNPDACVKFGPPCPFFPVCSGSGSLEDESLYRRVDSVHPELDDAA